MHDDEPTKAALLTSIEYRVKEIDKTFSGIVQLGIVIAVLLGLILWRIW